MNTQNNNQNRSQNAPDKLERLLRQWGCEEACNEIDAGSTPIPTPVASGFLFRWAPLASAAAVLLVAGVMFFLAPKMGPSSDISASELSSIKSELDSTKELMEKYKKLSENHDKEDRYVIAPKSKPGGSMIGSAKSPEKGGKGGDDGVDGKIFAGGKKGSNNKALQAEGDSRFSKLKSMYADAYGEAAAEAEEKIAFLSKEAEKAELRKRSLDQANVKLAKAEKSIEKYSIECDKLEDLAITKDMEVKLLRRQLARNADARRSPPDAPGGRKSSGRGRGKGEGVQAAKMASPDKAPVTDSFDKVSGYPRAYALDMDKMQVVLKHGYVQALAPGKKGLPAWQGASVQSRICQRSRVVRRQALSKKAKLLIDKLEFVIVRLSLLDTDIPGDVRCFVSMAKPAKLGDKIGDVLSCENEPAGVQAWLLEAGLILEGIDNAK